ncbi:MAG TPA: hydroxysqualene dehydroxylase HpnE [Vicinamibacterales bacterium]|nr:hydroxysqualene dehydroxylase HpnE [Vicinamibacterales bacterium]
MRSAEFDVAVVGGGVAGLAAATALAEAGKRVIVLEARGTLGGRATAFRDRVTGELVDNGQHVLFGCYHETFRFLRRVGAEDRVAVQPSLEVPYLDATGRRFVLRCPNWPPPLHLLGGILGWDALSFADKLRALRVAPGLAGTASRADETPGTVSDFLDWRGQRGRIRTWLWEPLAVAALNQAPNEAAAAPFIRVLQLMFAGSRTGASIALPLRPLHEMYAQPAQRFIEARGGAVMLNALARVRIEGGRVSALDVRGEPIAAAQVVAAVPWFALESLLTGEVSPMSDTIARATAMVSKPIVTVNLWYDRTVMEDEFVGLPERQMQWVFDKRRVFGESASHLSLVASGADALVGQDNAALIDLAAREVADGIPGARSATLVRGTVVREKRATFSVAPGQPQRPGVETPVHGLLLAGDWIDTGLPGTIESAAIAGHRAATSALDNFNRHPPIINP